MKIEESLLTKLEELAQIRLRPKERKTYLFHLEKVAEHFSELSKLDLSELGQMASEEAASRGPMGAWETPLRRDSPCPSLEVEELLKNAPAKIHDQFRVPSFVDSDS